MLTIDDIAEFTYMWTGVFFLQTGDKGNWIWKDPEYGGDNTIKPYNGTYQEYLRESEIPFGRSKGSHLIKRYCGTNVKIEN